MNYTIALKLTGYNILSNTVETFRFSNTGITASIDGDVGEFYYYPYVKDSIVLEQKTSSSNRNDAISIKLVNDSSLDYLIGYAFKGYTLAAYVSNNNASPIYHKLWDGEIDTFSIKELLIEIKGRSRFEILDNLINPTTFLGDLTTNPYDGDVDLKDKTKPRLLGTVFNITPVLINPSRLIYGFNWDINGDFAPVAETIVVRDGGTELKDQSVYVYSFDSKYAKYTKTSKDSQKSYQVKDFATTQAMDEYDDPLPGFYYTCKNDSTFKLGAKAVFAITIDVTSQFTYAKWIQIIAEENNLTTYSVHNSPSYILGGFFNTQTSYKKANDYLSENLDIHLWFDETGALNTKIIQDAGVTPEVTFIEAGIEFSSQNDIMFTSMTRDSYDLPVNKVELHYKKNYTVQDQSSLVTSATESEKALYKLESHTATSEKIWANDIYPIKNDIELETSIAVINDAEEEANRQLAKYSTYSGIDYVSIDVPILYENSNLIIGILSAGVSTNVDFSSSIIACDNTSLTMDNVNANFTGTQKTLLVGDPVLIKANRFDYSNTRAIVNSIYTNTGTMIATYQLQIPRIINAVDLPVLSGVTFVLQGGVAGVAYTSYDATVLFTGTVLEYTIVGTLPVGLSLDINTGVISGTPLINGVLNNIAVKATNSDGSVTSNTTSIVISEVPVAISVFNPPDGEVGTPYTDYDVSLLFTGNPTLYVLHGTLPAGLSFVSPIITGIPTTVVTATGLYIVGSNAIGQDTTTTADIIVATSESSPPVASGLFDPPNGVVAQSYLYATASLFTGGTVETYALNGVLPSGLLLDGNGNVTGVPTIAEIKAGISVTGTNTDGYSTTNTADIVISSQPIVPPIASGVFAPPQGTVGVAYTYNTSVLFTGGAVETFTLEDNTLPTGLFLHPITGEIYGTPTTVQTKWSISITGTNTAGSNTTNTKFIKIVANVCTVNAIDDSFTFDTNTDSIQSLDSVLLNDVLCGVEQIPVASGLFNPPDGDVNVAYSYATSVLFTVGVPTTYTLSGTLPSGLVLNAATGLISGNPATAETVTGISIIGSNTSGFDTTNSADITINDDLPIASGTFAPHNGIVGVPYSYPTAGLFTGGIVTSYALGGNPPPTGIVLNTATGELHGTPTAIMTRWNMSITGTNSSGSATTNDAKLQVVANTGVTVANDDVFSFNTESTDIDEDDHYYVFAAPGVSANDTEDVTPPETTTKILHLTRSTQYGLFSDFPNFTGNCELEFKFTYSSPDYIGTIVCNNTASNRIRIRWALGTQGKLDIYTEDHGPVSYLFNTFTGSLKDGHLHRIKLTQVGNTVTCFCDSEEVASTTTFPFLSAVITPNTQSTTFGKKPSSTTETWEGVAQELILTDNVTPANSQTYTFDTGSTTQITAAEGGKFIDLTDVLLTDWSDRTLNGDCWEHDTDPDICGENK